jgi:hypothetical protein
MGLLGPKLKGIYSDPILRIIINRQIEIEELENNY